MSKQLFRLPVHFVMLSVLILHFACASKENGQQSQNESGLTAVAADSLPTGDTIADTVSVAYLTGHFDPERHPDFVRIPDSMADRSGLFLRKEALGAFQEMAAEARKEGHHFTILSATRNFDYQKGIWERKWTGETILSNGKSAKNDYPTDTARARAILLYSSMPGTSRHHWGTDLDINALNNPYFETGEGTALFQWLEENAARFGFCRPYTAKGDDRPYGYEEEKWHWSYLPLSGPFTRAAQRKLGNADIYGFQGSQVAAELQVVEHYILGVSSGCR